MNFAKLKEKAILAKNIVASKTDSAISASARFLQKTPLHIKDMKEMQSFIEKTGARLSQSGKEITKTSLLIVVDQQTSFYKKMLFILPTLYTKAWTKNIDVKMILSDMKGLDIKKFKVETVPSLLVFRNKEIYKVVASEEKILKIVAALSLDVEKTIESL